MITLLFRRIIQHGVNMAFLSALLNYLHALHRAPMLDMFKKCCSGLLPCIAVCRFVWLSTWLSLHRADLALQTIVRYGWKDEACQCLLMSVQVHLYASAI